MSAGGFTLHNARTARLKSWRRAGVEITINHDLSLFLVIRLTDTSYLFALDGVK